MRNTQGAAASDQAVDVRLLTTAEELSEVRALERAVWRYEDIDLIPVTMLVASIKCGALVLGAFDSSRRLEQDAGELIGFAYSLPGHRVGRDIHWSHMLGVLPACRGFGLGHRLKMEQRRLVAERGFAEIDWTFDPLQAANAHLNLNKLGAVAAEFVENVYGESTSLLHRGAPTDRLIVHWSTRERPRSSHDHARDLDDIYVVNPVRVEAGWAVCDDVDWISFDTERLLICVPDDFSRMLVEAPERAIRWRLATRPLFADVLAAGYRAVHFVPLPQTRAGAYLFVRG